ncbi:MAG: hypothetical protein E6K50_00975 [Gammaproteobacteria bacterium]|nr:MAG: hypothetical protein E6K50_00975 [Gammaproteobacteria bacterium]
MFANPRLAAAAIASAVLLAACAASNSRQTTAAALTAILATDHRSQENRARDLYRHPKETLLFFGLRPEMSVLEVWPEPGWYTEVIAPLVRDKGKYYAAVIAADPESKYITQRAQDPKAKSGYVNEDYAIRLIEAQGFRLVAKSQVNANPKDTKDYEQGVWTLPPTYRLGDKDRDKYAAIGESDRFTLRFVKPLK